MGAVLSWLSLAVLSGLCWEVGTTGCPQTASEVQQLFGLPVMAGLEC